MAAFVTSDWHLGEDRFEIMARPFTSQDEMVDALVDNHNKLVGPDDDVFMLGDVCYQKQSHWLEHTARFNGKKKLVRGNHDRVIPDEDFLKYFEVVVPEGDGIELTVEGIPCYLTHYPSTARQDLFNLVGHIHAAWKYQLNSINVGVDVNHFRPVNLKTIPFHFKAVCEFYDNDCWAAYNSQNEFYRGKRGKAGNYFTKPKPGAGYCYACDGEYKGFFIIEKAFWEKNHHCDDGLSINELKKKGILPAGFHEAMESFVQFEGTKKAAIKALEDAGFERVQF